ncbi:MAG: U32 family peptidase, partial [Clostridiales bacterium]|nr:U32 family peptidase [Clostridiales bacterium]
MTKTGKLPELLAPAGSDESLRAALAAGADAVYFGSSVFSNRMRAKNFAGDALSDAIRLTHAAGAKAHITVNTRVRDREMDEALALCDRILSPWDDSRADAIIIADMGLAAEIKKRWPDAVLHASTQTSMGSPADCRTLSDLGFRRLVLPRELSREEIARLCG